MKKWKELWVLLLEFMRFGCFTFGGGWSIIAQMQQLYVEKKKVITSEELLDLTSVAKSLPGTMIANVAMLYGYRAAGLAGGFVCVFGMILPPLLILIAISFCYNAFRNNYWVVAAMEGMQAAVVPIIASAAINLAKGSVKYPPLRSGAAAQRGAVPVHAGQRHFSGADGGDLRAGDRRNLRAEGVKAPWCCLNCTGAFCSSALAASAACP